MLVVEGSKARVIWPLREDARNDVILRDTFKLNEIW